MTTYPAFTAKAEKATQVWLMTKEQWEAGPDLPAPLSQMAKAQGFKGAAGQTVLTANADAQIDAVLFGLGDGSD